MKTIWHILPWKSLTRVAEVMTHGMKKYGKDTWKDYTVEEQLDAAIRHLNAHLNGETINSEDWGLNHLDHAACRVLMAAQILIEQQKAQRESIRKLVNGHKHMEFQDQHWLDAVDDQPNVEQSFNEKLWLDFVGENHD